MDVPVSGGYNVRVMEKWIWRNIGFTVPTDWEMLQFSRSAESGRCAFADRYQFRLELDWRVVPGPPDFDRMTSDYLARLREKGMEGGSRFRLSGWHGVDGDLDGRRTTRLGRHFGAEKCLVEVVFLWPGRKDTGLLRRVVGSVDVEPEHDGRYRRWRAFGMDLLAARDLPLERCTAEPANVEMMFADPKHRSVNRFARRGMVREWMQQTLEQWLRGWVDRGLDGIRQSTCDARGHRVAVLTGSCTLPGMPRRRADYTAAAWRCPQDGRLYSAACSRRAKPNELRPMLAGSRLSCCAAMELPL
ncbi:MAG: hypothetical protein ABIF82_10040 [Planctomycetota bacterium]